MGTEKFIKICIDTLVKYSNAGLCKTDKNRISEEDVYVVWNCKTLQNNKALLSTNLSDGMYYEFTHNRDKKEIYLDAYKKQDNMVITFNT